MRLELAHPRVEIATALAGDVGVLEVWSLDDDRRAGQHRHQLRRAEREGAGAACEKRSSPHCPVRAMGESITRVPLMGISEADTS